MIVKQFLLQTNYHLPNTSVELALGLELKVEVQN